MRFLTTEIPELRIVPDFQATRLGIVWGVLRRHGMEVVGHLLLLVLTIPLRVLLSAGLDVMRGMPGMAVVVYYLQRREIPVLPHQILPTTASPLKPVM